MGSSPITRSLIREIPDAAAVPVGEPRGGMVHPEVPTRLCRLEETAGRCEACPEDSCAFWEPGGAVLEGRCVLEGIDFSREPGLADWLLEMRKLLEQVGAHHHA